MQLVMLLRKKWVMKKIFNKLFKRNEASLSSRITSDTVAEHRERILAGGRRFKYPIQYARHKLVINAILISISALVVVIATGWWQLYLVGNNSEFVYRITKVIPLPVAKVDGKFVLYSDYLMKYLGSVHFLEQIQQVSLKTEDGKRQIEYYKQESMQGAISDAYAMKLADDMNLSVSDSELQGFLKLQRQLSSGEMSEATYNASMMSHLGWSPNENSHALENNLLRQKVSYAMDSDAKSVTDSVENVLKNDSNADFKSLVALIPAEGDTKALYEVSGWVPRSNYDGLVVEAAKLTKNQISPVIKPTKGDGYYIIRLIDSNEDQVNYEYIKIPLTAFEKSLKTVIDEKKVNIYIEKLLTKIRTR